jgi:hypothetical protein
MLMNSLKGCWTWRCNLFYFYFLFFQADETVGGRLSQSKLDIV